MKTKVIILSLLATTAVASGKILGLQQHNVANEEKEATLPYNQTFESQDDAEAMTIIDANNDGNTWMFFGDCMIYGVSDDGSAADDWLITPALPLASDSVYEVSASVHADDSWAEQFSIWAGTDASVGTMTQQVLPNTTVTQDDYVNFSSYFRPSGSDPLHIGLHVTTPGEDGSYIYVNRIGVKAVSSVSAPAAAKDFNITVTDKGQTANLQFIAPSTDYAGVALQTIDRIEVSRNGQIVNSINDVKPGEACTVTDKPGEDGFRTYTIVAYNSYGAGVPVSARAYMGEDIPLPVTEAAATAVDNNGNISISWKAPGETGVHGGYVNVDSLTYVVSGIGGNANRQTTVSGTSLTDAVTLSGDAQKLVSYTITPRSAVGRGEGTRTNGVFLGNPYTLPYTESFPRRQQQKGPWDVVNDEVAEWDIMQYGTYAEAADYDGGLLAFSTTTEGRSATMTGPKLSLKGANNARLQLQVYYMNRAPHVLHISLLTPDGKLHELDSFSPVDKSLELNSGEWKNHSYDISDYSKYDFVQLVLKGVGGHTDDLSSIVPLYVDNIRFDNPVANDLVASTLSSENDHVNVGDGVKFHFTIVNKGTAVASGYKAMLYRDGLCVDSVYGKDINSDDSIEVALKDVVNADAKETSHYHATVVWDEDADDANNSSSNVAVTVLPGKPFLTEVTAESTGNGVTLSWNQPEGIDKDAQPEDVTEDFESYDAFNIHQMGQWTLVDGDGHNTIGIQNGTGDFVQYPNVESPMAYMVFNPSAANLNSYYFSAHSGKQVAAAFSAGRYDRNDDWLISPAVDGAQTITFWACSPDASYYGTQEQVQVLASTTDADTASFSPVGGTINVSGQWTKYTAALPEGTRYFALRCVSMDQYILFLDDISYRKAARDFSLAGYNVYRDGVLIGTCSPADFSFVDKDGSKEHSYSVSAVYNVGESRQTNAVWQEQTGITMPTVSVTDSQSPMYNLAGQRVGKNYRGVVIQNGKKFIVK